MSAITRPAATSPNLSAKPGATIILIPMSLRALWMDVMAIDKRIDNATFRFAAIVGAHFNRRSGDAFMRLDTIADAMGMSERTAFSCAKKLEDLGYLNIKRRELGTITRKTANGEFQVRVAGGKGVANVYAPAIEGAQVVATSGEEKLKARLDLLKKLSVEKPKPKVATDCDQSEPKVATHCDLSTDQRSQSGASMVATHCDPTLSLSSKENLTRAREPTSASALGSLAAIIAHATGEDEFRSWFSLALIAADTPDCLCISLPTRFKVSEVQKRYGDNLLRWVQLIDQGKKRVEIVLREAGR
jgi:hypothetical protein